MVSSYQLPAEAELLLMIKGPLVTQAEKSSSDPRWKRGCAEVGLEVAWHMAADTILPEYPAAQM